MLCVYVMSLRVPIWQMGKLEHRGVESLVPGHRADKLEPRLSGFGLCLPGNEVRHLSPHQGAEASELWGSSKGWQQENSKRNIWSVE